MKKLKYFLSAVMILCFFAISRGEVWQLECPDSTGTDKGEYNSLAIDSEDNPHIVYYDGDFKDLRYAYYRNGTWTVEIVDSIGDAGKYCSIALDSQNIPHISYQQEYLGYHWSLKYATLVDTGWYKVLVDCPQDTSIGEIGEFSSIAINNDGFPCISYLQDNPDEVKYAYLDSVGWHIDVINSFGIMPGYNKLRLKNGETPIIGYHRLGDQNADILEIAYFIPADSSWDIITMPDSVDHISFGHLVGFDIDSQNNAYFAYFNPDYDLQLAVFDSLSWSIETILDYPYFGGRPTFSLKIDNADQPCLATFQDGIYFYRKTNGQWDTSFVSDQISPGWYCSLKFDSENHPRISVYARTLSYSVDALFYYRYWPGDPLMVLPDTTHNYGIIWIESYSDWNCPIENDGTAPLIIDELELTSPWTDSSFQVIDVILPMTILPQESDSIMIRFDPFDEETHFDTLIIYSNDTLHSEERVVIQGTGTASGDFGNLTVYAKNCYAALEYHSLNELPLAGAQISLYQDNQLIYGPVESAVNGTAILEDVAVGEYDLTITREVLIPGEDPALSTLGNSKDIEIGPGHNTNTIVLPESLMVQKYQSVFDLMHINRYSPQGETLYTFWYPSENDVADLLDSWQVSLDSTTALSISRLYLAEVMTHQMFNSGYSIGGAFIRCISELINFIFYADSWFDTLWDFLMSIVELFTDPISALLGLLADFAKYFLLSLMGDAVQQAAAEIPCDQGDVICGEEIVMAAWNEIRGQYTFWDVLLPNFSSDSWGDMEDLIHRTLKGPVFQEVYVDLLTDEQIELAIEYSEDFDFDGEFEEASEYTAEFISDKTDDVETDVEICGDLIESAQIFMATAMMLDIVDDLNLPGMGFIGAIGDALEIAAYVEVVSGIALSGYTLFTLPDEMENAVDRIYHPNGLLNQYQETSYPLPRAKSDPQLIAFLKQNLQQSTDDFDSTLLEIKDEILQGNMENALLGLEGLMNADNNLRNDLNVACAPVYAVVIEAKDSIDGFPEMYDSLKSSYAKSGIGRLKDYLYIAFLPTDSSQAMEDMVIAQIDSSIERNQVLVDNVNASLDTTAFLPVPAIVVVNDASQDIYNIGLGETATIQVKLQHVGGAIPAEDVSLVLRTSNAIQVNEADSIYIGALSPGEETSYYTWTVNLYANGYTRGAWTADIISSNAKTYSYTGSFVTPKIVTPSTGGELSSENVYNYPNPFNPDLEPTNLRYSLAMTAEVTIKIYDGSGNLVKTVINNVSQTGGEEQIASWDGKNSAEDIVANGVYFFIIESSRGERAVGKIAVLR